MDLRVWIFIGFILLILSVVLIILSVVFTGKYGNGTTLPWWIWLLLSLGIVLLFAGFILIYLPLYLSRNDDSSVKVRRYKNNSRLDESSLNNSSYIIYSR